MAARPTRVAARDARGHEASEQAAEKVVNTINGQGNGNGTSSSAAVTRARPLILVRARPGMAPESARVVHLAPLPSSGFGAISAMCGALLRPEEHETVRPGLGTRATSA